MIESFVRSQLSGGEQQCPSEGVMQFSICVLIDYPGSSWVGKDVPGCLDPTALLIMSTTISGSGDDRAGLVNIES